jgi:hypothetical protein
VQLRDWIEAEHAAVVDRFERSIGAVVPPDRWRDPAGRGGSSIVFLLFHAAYHADLAANAVIGGDDPLLSARRVDLGVAAFPPAAGLAEAEDAALRDALDLDALASYGAAVDEAVAGAIATAVGVDGSALRAIPDAGAALARAGVEEAAVPWLYSMWEGRPVSFFLQWEAIGHRLNHLGEMVSVRNRLGLSPF